jgi:polyhydroxyalkanoate synthesis regulator phasin
MPLPLDVPAQYRPRGKAASENPLGALTMPSPELSGELDFRRIQGPTARDHADLAMEQDRDESARIKQQVRAANSDTLSRYEPERRPTYEDPATGILLPKDSDQKWAQIKQQRDTRSSASQEAALDAAARLGLGKPLPTKKREELQNTVTSQRETLDSAARDFARKQIEETPTFKDANTGYFDFKLDKQPADEAGKKLLETHKRLADTSTPLDEPTLTEVRRQYEQADPTAQADYQAKESELNADTDKRQKLSLLRTKEQRARAIAAGNNPAEVERLLPKTPDEIKADLNSDNAKLSEIRARSAQGVSGTDIQTHAEEEKSLIRRIHENQRAYQNARATQQQSADVDNAAAAASGHQAAASVLEPQKAVAPPLTEKNGALVEESFLGDTTVATRTPDGAFNASKAGALDRVVQHSGDTPVYYRDQTKKDEVADTALPQAREQAARHYDEQLPRLQSARTALVTEAAAKRDAIIRRVKQGEITPETGTEVLNQQMQELESQHEDGRDQDNNTLQEALEDFGAGHISAQQLNKVFAAAGAAKTGVAAFQEGQAQIEKDQRVIDKHVKSVQEEDPALSWAFRGPELAKRQAERDQRAGSSKDAAEKIQAAEKALQELAPKVDAYDQKLNAELEKEGYSGPALAAIKQRIRLKALEDLPVGYKEKIAQAGGYAEYYAGKLPLCGRIRSTRALHVCRENGIQAEEWGRSRPR